jgi:release factor glutamine methyltransferase
MRRFFKRVVSFFLVPITRWYLQKERTYKCDGIRVLVLPGVFHPGFFSSTSFILEFLKTQQLSGKTLLELGCGTGLISVYASKHGATVTASDLSETAIRNCEINNQSNQTNISVIHSDLFDSIQNQTFDWIIVNPPYYARLIKNEEELAWHCGENFEYFQKLFASIKDYVHKGTQVVIVLTLGCDLEKIFQIGAEHKLKFELLREKNVLFDGKDFLYRINSLGDA